MGDGKCVVLVSRVFTIPTLFHGIITIWRAESPPNRMPKSRFYSKMESFGTENSKMICITVISAYNVEILLILYIKAEYLTVVCNECNH